jgi:hypothetical protein
MMVATLCVLLVAAASGPADRVVVLQRPGYVLPYGKTAERAWKVPDDCRSVRLRISVRMDFPQPAGSTNVLRMQLNGKPIAGSVDRSHCRLLNKPMLAGNAQGTEMSWVDGSSWRVPYAPDFKVLESEKAGANYFPGVSAYRLVLDVTDLVARGGENTLRLEHRGEAMRLRRYFPKSKASLDLVFDQLEVEFSSQPPMGGAPPPEETFRADRLMVQPPATVEVSKAVGLAPGGGLRIDLPGLPLQVVSRFSFQGGGFNVLSADGPPNGQPQWKVTTARSGDEYRVDATARDYQLQRRIRLAGDHLEVADRLTNLTGADIGLAFDNRIVGPPGRLPIAWLGGNPDPSVSVVDRLENSSVFVADGQNGCGLLAVDDVYRIQGVFYYDQGAGARSATFAIGPRATYTLRWNLYPVLRADYYDFVNLARRDLDVNFTISGGFQFGLGASSDDAYRGMAQQRGLKFMASGVWSDPGAKVPCYHGEHMLQAAALQERLRERCQTIRRVLPQVKTLIYIHSFINTDPEGPRKHPDAHITNPDGTPYQNKTYTAMYGTPFFYDYPALEPENSYVEAMRRVIDMCLDRDKIGADGVYWDELDWISTKYTFDRWDGHSAELDEQHRIRRKMAYVHLLSLSAKVKLIQYIFAKGGILIGNSVATSQTLSGFHFPRFVETSAAWYPARAHLYSPISLGDHLTVKDFAGLWDDIRAKVMWGSLYYYYATPKQPYGTITQHMFPFTPVELHHGWLLGRERIVTAVPGTFTFSDMRPLRVYWYDSAGKLTDRPGQERAVGNRRLVRLALSEREMAVIERTEPR